jgi:hypothetical protein
MTVQFLKDNFEDCKKLSITGPEHDNRKLISIVP